MIGIYKYTNKINGKIYIGQSIDIEKRYNSHITKTPKLYIDAAIKKYSISNFIFEVIDTLTDSTYSKELLNEKEIYWIAYYESSTKGYNQNNGGNIIRDKDWSVYSFINLKYRGGRNKIIKSDRHTFHSTYLSDIKDISPLFTKSNKRQQCGGWINLYNYHIKCIKNNIVYDGSLIDFINTYCNSKVTNSLRKLLTKEIKYYRGWRLIK